MLITEGHKEAALMARLSSFIHSFKEKGKKGEVNGESETGGERAGAETKSVCSYLHFIVRGAQITHTHSAHQSVCM
jgi:hypothetical protein